MNRIHFIKSFDYVPSENRNITYAFHEGVTADVSEECAVMAVALGYAIPVEELDELEAANDADPE